MHGYIWVAILCGIASAVSLAEGNAVANALLSNRRLMDVGRAWDSYTPCKDLDCQRLDEFTSATSRAILQTDPELCGWDSDSEECFANLITNIPDKRIQDSFFAFQVCELLFLESICVEAGFCRWRFPATCGVDMLGIFDECIEDDYKVFRRSFECLDISSEEECNSEKGCIWSQMYNPSRCTAHVDTVTEVFFSNESSRLAREWSEFNTCITKPIGECDGDCELSVTGQICLYQPILDIGRYFKSSEDSSFCTLWRKWYDCNAKEGESCTDECELDEDGCFLSTDALIDLAYTSNTELGDKMKSAEEICPTLESQKTCEEFAG